MKICLYNLRNTEIKALNEFKRPAPNNGSKCAKSIKNVICFLQTNHLLDAKQNRVIDNLRGATANSFKEIGSL